MASILALGPAQVLAPSESWQGTLEGRMAVSATLHLLVFFLAANAWWMGARRLRAPGSPAGSTRLMIYSASKPLPPAPQAHKTPVHSVRPAPAQITAPAQVPDLEQATSGGSEQALGNGEVSITYVRAFPAQKPDLAGTPPTGDITLDIDIDQTGHIARIHTRTGISDTVDRMVIATVEQWIFQPAMRNGHPISSSEELRFHYDRARNPAGCGWECFTLEAQ